MCWEAIVRRKESKHASRGLIQKRKDIAEINNNQDVRTIVVKEEWRKAKDNWDEHVKK